jgi:hypothetical protein
MQLCTLGFFTMNPIGLVFFYRYRLLTIHFGHFVDFLRRWSMADNVGDGLHCENLGSTFRKVRCTCSFFRCKATAQMFC